MTDGRSYHDVLPMSRLMAQREFVSGESSRICHALVRITFHDADWRWVQSQCLLFAEHADTGVRGLALTCLGHIARIHRRLDTKLVVPLLHRLRTDPEVGGRADDALNDIATYLGQDSLADG